MVRRCVMHGGYNKGSKVGWQDTLPHSLPMYGHLPTHICVALDVKMCPSVQGEGRYRIDGVLSSVTFGPFTHDMKVCTHDGKEGG